MTRTVRGVLLVAAIIAFTAGTAAAQGNGTIFGKVTDTSGASVPGVTVTVTGPALAAPLVTVTITSGAYQFPTVPIGTFVVKFEAQSFKTVNHPNVVIITNFNAQIDAKMEIGKMTDETTVSAAPPVVDTKKTNTGQTFTRDVMDNIPTARDPWQVIGLTPGVKAGMNVGGSSSGQQVSLEARGTTANVQWNLEGGNITDLSSNSSPSYFNFDSFEQIQVTTGGGDVSIQSSGLFINLVTKSGSNVFKGSSTFTYEDHNTQSRNITPAIFALGSNGFISGAPIKKIDVLTAEYGGPIKKNRLWFWGAWDRQDINAGVLNFFQPGNGTSFCDTLIAAQNAGQVLPIVYSQLDQVVGCLRNDRTLIKDIDWKVNYQLNASNKFQWLFESDNKYRNARGATATTAVNATTQQTSASPWHLPLPTHQFTHTWIATNKLVFNNQYTYVDGGFFLDYQDVPPQGTCAQSAYLDSSNNSDYLTGGRAQTNPATATCLWDMQHFSNTTTGRSAVLTSTYHTQRKGYDLKSDATYFLSNFLGGDHSLKFGAGWHRAPVMTFNHFSGGGTANMQCVGNATANCATNIVAAGSSGIAGLVPRSATFNRDSVTTNNNWWTYDGYLQDSYSHGRLRLNGGVRYDWQQSKELQGCVPANIVFPTLLPGECETANNLSTVVDVTTGKLITNSDGTNKMVPIQSFGNLSPRISATYDLTGKGKTQVHAGYNYYFATKITLASNLSTLGNVSLSTGVNQTNGLCSTAIGTSCWNDANQDGLVQASEIGYSLGGTTGLWSLTNPNTGVACCLTASTARYNASTGLLSAAGNTIDKSAKLGRTREAVVGIQHELIPNLAIGVDYTYRINDQGTRSYNFGAQPAAYGGTPCPDSGTMPNIGTTTSPVVNGCYPTSVAQLNKLYSGPFQYTYTDAVTGAVTTANYYVRCATCTAASGVGTVTITNPNYNHYSAIDITANKRFSNRWQLGSSLTLQRTIPYVVLGTYSLQGYEYTNQVSTVDPYNFKLYGSVALWWGFQLSGNMSMVPGAIRNENITGPGAVTPVNCTNGDTGVVTACSGGVNYSATTGNLVPGTNTSFTTFTFQKPSTVRLNNVKLLDLSAAKVFSLKGGKYRIKVMIDAFNIFNINTALDFASDTLGGAAFGTPDSLPPPRVVRFGAQINF